VSQIEMNSKKAVENGAAGKAAAGAATDIANAGK